MSDLKQKTIYLVYIHGFRGDHTTFQAFPTDLHERLLPRLPPKLKLKSSLYPTYKSVRPISEATHNFLKWLNTQPPGPVILLGHSMGGLLAAEAATSSLPQSKRVIGLIAFDTPFLGMHPHVVVSGIASLFPKDAEEPPKTEKELNDTNQIHMVDEKAVDDWDAYKATLRVPNPRASSSQLSLHQRSRSPTPTASPPSSPPPSSPRNFLDRTVMLVSKYADDPVVKWMKKHSDEPFAAMKRWVVEHFEFGICMFDPSGLRDRYQTLEKWDGRWVNYWTETVPKMKKHGVKGGEEKTEEEKNMKVDDARIEDGTAANSHPSVLPSNTADLAVLETDVPAIEQEEHSGPSPDVDPKAAEKERKKVEKERARAEKAHAKAVKDAEKALKKEREREKKNMEPRPGRHFIVQPLHCDIAGLGSGEKWERVQIAGVEDEVAAHCGLFIKSQNVDYDAFLERVGNLVLDWCSDLAR